MQNPTWPSGQLTGVTPSNSTVYSLGVCQDYPTTFV